MKNPVKLAKIAYDFEQMSGNDLIIFSRGTVLGLTDNLVLTNPTISLATVTTQTDEFEEVVVDIEQGNTTPNNTKLMALRGSTLMLSLTTNGHYTEDKANAVAAGNLFKAEQIILSSGYKLKNKPVVNPRGFEVVKTGTGWLHFHVRKSKKGHEIFYWSYGIVATKGAIPETLIQHVTDKADIIITDLPSGSIVAMAHASNEIGPELTIPLKPCQ